MSEYVDREAFIAQKRELYCKDCDRRKGIKNGKYRILYDIGDVPCRACGIEDVLSDVEDFPTADVQPVKHGRWIQDEHTYSGCWTYNYVCSACGEIGGSWLRNIRRDQMFPYCPFCGAKMDEEDDND